MAGPLDGMKVVELGVAMAGPFCSMTLGDYGAQVIKVERIGVGDDSRYWGEGFHGVLAGYYACTNRNKRGIAVDLKNPEGAALVRRLVDQADVLVDNYRVGALARAGLDYEQLRETNPRLIYCSISGFGATGPLSKRPANDLFMQAYTGGMSLTGEPDGGPVKMGPSVCDVTAGMMATIGVLLAVEARHRTGRGQRVDTSLLEGQISMLGQHLTRLFATGEPPTRTGSAGLGGNPTYRAFEACDGWLVIACFNDRMFRDLCTVLDQQSWVTDERFQSNSSRTEHRDFLAAAIAQIIAKQPTAHWLEHFEAAGVPCSPINTLDRLVREEQLQARECLVDIDLPGLGSMRMGGLPVKLSETPGSVALHPPRLGQHTEVVLREIGLSAIDIADLAERGVVATDAGWSGPNVPANASH
ncbi:formyl-CoA transferase/CoA:oxalate CoA-transferase [Burkholderia sp. WP9]|uniref:CaiB/BaiF CoA transferase family protein n=1 Tax=Burkholderia sp. WP9 TaxID=1500263 RepID=UPI00089BC340|nr:CaiB/BaiF CoA-transferase family protein [Burkholderia sp. WP9]SEF13808.1 formyl-CoA transferase/CoA:oxalate CoA-transferase [Burkholderia sp. WP9]